MGDESCRVGVKRKSCHFQLLTGSEDVQPFICRHGDETHINSPFYLKSLLGLPQHFLYEPTSYFGKVVVESRLTGAANIVRPIKFLGPL